MTNEKINNRHLTLILIAGTIVRFIYGYSTKAWLSSPDQLAWGLSIDEMFNSLSFSYLQFIHYPHEGGSFLFGFISILFRPFENILPTLSWVALAIDFFSRLIQIRVAEQVFGKQVALWFGVWTIFSIPLLIPWTIVNFGMHALSSFFPFLFLYIAVTYKQSKNLIIFLGLLSGIAISYSYDNISLVILSILYILLSENFTGMRVKSLLKFSLTCFIILMPHLYTRIFIDTGFGLEKNPVASIRGVPLNNFLTTTSLTNFMEVWYKTLPGSFLLNSPALLSSILKYIIAAFILTGIIFFIRSKTISLQTKSLSISLVIIFFILYAFSPFFTWYFEHKGYVFYRHLCYIIPILVLIMMAGFYHSEKRKYFLLVSWILLCVIASTEYIYSTKKTEHPLYKAAGWVTARKFGHNTEKLFKIRDVSKAEFRDEFTIGLGWGLSATILENKKEQKDLLKLISIVEKCPIEHREKIIEGVHFSFSDKVTPVLDSKFKTDFDKLILPLQIK